MQFTKREIRKNYICAKWNDSTEFIFFNLFNNKTHTYNITNLVIGNAIDTVNTIICKNLYQNQYETIQFKIPYYIKLKFQP